uniref:RING-type domain-containing protein n=1 Tax=Kalanchoe fedtschenkoi TaxID=63787 RepID=A0A7N0U4T3_KALFE
MESCTRCESGKEKRGMIISMNTRCFTPVDAACNPSGVVPPGDVRGAARTGPPARGSRSSVVIRLAMRVSRSKWFSFLRRVFQYQNGTRSDPSSNPLNSGFWMMLELVALAVQLSMILVTLSVSKKEKPFWPLRIWIAGYEIGCFLSLLMLYGRYRQLHLPRVDGSSSSLSDVEEQRTTTDSRISHLTNKCKTSLDLFFAIWFVMGNVWVFDSRLGSFHRAPNLHFLSLTLLAWNAICYSFPFLLFLLLCCIVPLVSSLLGYNMNMGSTDRGASDDQISHLASWRYKEAIGDIESANNANEDTECCICLAKYKDKEEVRQLPCSHIFHLKCVDQWLRIISCCPLCKRELH